ncbi:hypothetical protein [Sphingomonas sp. CFBP 8760]|uniref:hypothetical protein n=1 Tax=Sphingomonas sp. CFBP 8760 TaxID=2775282 RepID=UPI001780BE32|nr:hypothetical protein [Sphingomonas sp. CFBP 8760]MBD8548281.1 hypothetical protein [Sphingomonas sp. CFBP 8760]
MTSPNIAFDTSKEDGTEGGSRTTSQNGRTSGRNLGAILAMLTPAALLSLFLGLCYFYNRSQRLAYFGSFGLDPNAVPIAVQDAIVDGFLGINEDVLWFVAILAAMAAIYVSLVLFGSHYLERFVARFGFPVQRPTPSAVLVEIRKNDGFRMSILASAIAMIVTLAGVTALLVIGLPADASGRRTAKMLKDDVASIKPVCSRYRLKGSVEVVGIRIGNTAERQFVMANDDALHVLKFDDVDRLFQKPVPCRMADRSGSVSRRSNHPS